MAKTLRYLVVDTETATLPMCADLAFDAESKKKLAIAKPLVYDIGWTITNRKGEILDHKQYLVAETFAVPQIFNTAYYAEKRPLYLEMLSKGETSIKTWDEIMNIFLKDMRTVDAAGAYNAMFDFKKAIPFTELYIRNLYSDHYMEWEKIQKESCRRILASTKPERNPDFDAENFRFRGEIFPLFDLWGLAAKILLNNVSYKKNCLDHDLLSASGLYFKTSAESTYQYICDKYDFVESHTALDDAMIETYILAKIANRHAISIGITFFPFRELGETVDFVQRLKKPNVEECEKVIAAIEIHLESKEEGTAYYSKMEKKIDAIMKYMGRE